MTPLTVYVKFINEGIKADAATISYPLSQQIAKIQNYVATL